MPNIETWQVELAKGTTSIKIFSFLDAMSCVVPIDSLDGLALTIPPDLEGDALAMRLAYSGPGGISGTSPEEGWAQRIALTDAIPAAPNGTYQFHFIVSEDGNAELQSSLGYTIALDPNCYVIDEPTEWNQYRLMTGSVVVLDGGSLRVTKDTLVEVVRAGSLTITVRPGGGLEVEPGSVFQPQNWQPEQRPGTGWRYWGGIVAEESAGGKAATVRIAGTIRGALRGVTVNSGADATIEGASIEWCRIGVHAVGPGADPIIAHTRFSDSARYGIKEDLGASPLVTYCEFAANTYDYYDDVLTVVGAEGINAVRPGNSGNISVGGSP
jgi:hypothetical protein